MGEYKIREGLIDYRRSAHLTQAQMGEKLFMSRQVYARYESKKPPVPDLDTLCRMAEVTGKPVEYLLFGKETSEDKVFKELPENLQLLCRMYFHLNIQGTTNFQFMYILLKFLETEQKRGIHGQIQDQRRIDRIQTP